MVEFGKKIYPKKKKVGLEKAPTFVKGPYWSISLLNDKYVFEYLSGSHGGGVKRCIVTKEDFEAVKSEEMTEYDLALKYDLS